MFINFDEQNANNIAKQVTASLGKNSKKSKAANFGLFAGRQFKKEKPKATTKTVGQKEKKPRAVDVRAALKAGKITPVEAGDLNPLGGINPKVKDVREAIESGRLDPRENPLGAFKPGIKDVRAAYEGGHITEDEATGLNRSFKTEPITPINPLLPPVPLD